jgi:hypothetical protein
VKIVCINLGTWDSFLSSVTWKAEMVAGRSWFQASPGKKLHETPSQQKNPGVMCTPVIPAIARSIKQEDPGSRPAQAKSETLFSKTTRAERTGGVAQEIETLPSKGESVNCQKKEKRKTKTKYSV